MKKFLSLFIILFALSCCTDNIDRLEDGLRAGSSDHMSVFRASTEGPSSPTTKVYADEEMKVLWNADDRVSIFNLTTYNYQYAFTGDDGDTAGGFDLIPDSGFITGQNVDYVYAAYPYSKSNKLSNQGVFTMVLPAEQSYKEHSFGIGANTMVAITDGSFLAFKNVGGYLSLRLYGDNISVSRITIKGNNGEKIAGKASIDIPFGGTPTVTMDESATDEVSIVCDPAVKIGEDANSYTDFWFVIPPVTFSKGFTITVTDDKGGVFEKATSKSFTVSRNTLDWMSALKVVPNYDNVNIQFEDANFKAYCVENFDRNNDGEISGAEAKIVTEIDVNTDNITSLGGIEYFTSLKSLQCYGSMSGEGAKGQLTSLDLSNNIELTNLVCYYNPLESLNVSKNTALTVLKCYRTQLTSLDVNNNTALIELDCSWNQLTFLNVKNNLALKDLSCGSNQLTSLDVSKNADLEYLSCSSNQLAGLNLNNNTSLKELNCGSNQLSSLDISKHTALLGLFCANNLLTSLDVSHNTELELFSCGGNQLYELDVSKNEKLKELYCFKTQVSIIELSNNTALQVLSLHDLPLTSLNISKNTALTYLDCRSNQLTNLDVSHNTALTELHCRSNQLTSLDLSNNTALTILYCQNNQLTSLNVSHNTALATFRCESNQLNSLDVSSNSLLSNLNCTNNPLLTEIWLKTDQFISTLRYDSDVATIKYKDASGSEIITFEDENFKAYCVENFDKNGDGEISYAEALLVTQIDCYSKSIQSLSGIEYFTNLTSLNCYSNQLTSLDVSNNTALTNLNCASNHLTSLDVSNNTALTHLFCGSNQLTSLDVSHNTTLSRLYCSDNQLNGLGVSHNTMLVDLECNSNQLTSLDLSNNTQLTGLYCQSNQLTSLDVSNNTALTSLGCSSNQLTSLDVSKNDALLLFTCNDNQLTSLDVSNNTKLSIFHCYNNQLTNLDVSNNTELTELWCSDNRLAGLIMGENKALKYLGCYNNRLTNLDISSNTQLSTLNCYNNLLSCLDVSNNISLTVLKCQSNPYLTEIWLKEWQTILTFNYDSSVATIKYKEGNHNKISFDDENFKFLCVISFDKDGDGEISISEAEVVTSINISTYNISSLEGIEYFCNLTDLSCYGNSVSDRGLLTSLDLSKNVALQSLYCHNNQLTSLDLSKNEALTRLCCSGNQLTVLDLSNNTSLTTLYCHYNTLLTEIWLKTGQTLQDFRYDTDIATIKYKD